MRPLLTLVLVLLSPLASCGAAPARPNFVFFLVDDMGWQETSVPFHTDVTALNRRYHTPNMERLAAQGMKFTQAYASAVCSPTRVSALTGMNAARHRVTNWTLRRNASPDNPSQVIEPPAWNVNGISASADIERTTRVTPLPALLRPAGYRTIHVGKAHFGAKDTPGEDPLNLGFDVNIAGHCAGGPGSYWGAKNFSAAWRTQPPDTIWDVPGLEGYHGQDIHLTEALTREAIRAVEASVKERQPFYLYMSHYAVHAPWEKDDRFHQRYLDAGLSPFDATLASMIEGMDRSLGDLMDTLDRLGVAEDTVVLFMSDNGSPSQCPRNLPLRGHKLTPYEGGIREPMIVKWPGVTPPGSTCREPVIIEDFFPTILEIAGVDWRGRTVQAVDGHSFVPLLKGDAGSTEDRALLWHFPNNYSGQTPYSAIRQGPWKLIYHHADRRLELFDIDAEIGEARELAKVQPEKTAELALLLGDRLRAADAQMPKDLATGRPVEWPDQVVRASRPIRVACLGDSITFGAGAASPEQESYPAQLASVLGTGYDVRNFGVGGCTLLFEGDRPYRGQPQFQAAVDFDPDIVLLLLGANDTCGAPRNNWDHSASFLSDARALIRTLHRPGRRILVALPSPFLTTTPGLKPERRADLEERNPRLEQIRGWWREAAQAEGVERVDLADALAPDPQLTTDGVHLTRAGYARIAGRFRDALLSNPVPGKPPAATRNRGPSAARKVPDSSLAKALVWQGVAIEEPGHTIWGASPIVADGQFHLFAARWPEANVDPAWRKDGFIEDGSAFLWDGKVCLLTTDNHGAVTGVRGGGALWVSDDGIRFRPEWTQLGFDRIPRHFPGYDPSRVRRIYGGDPKFERPKVLCLDGRPAWLYAPSGWNVTGSDRTVAHVLRIDLKPGDGPLPRPANP